MEYLPNSTTGAELLKFVNNFGENYTKYSSDLRKNIDEAIDGCDKAEKLVKNCEEKAVKLTSMTSCSQCKKPIFTESGIVYPCSHILHYKCAKELANQIKNEKIDFTADCPICGFLSIKLIDQPFILDKDSDHWSVDPVKLANTVTIQRKKTTNILYKNEK